MKPTSVALFDLGETEEMHLSTLARKLNKLQSSIYFEAIDSVPTASVGAPNVLDQWYEIPSLLRQIREHPKGSGYDFLVAVTRFKITDPKDPLAKKERDYFSKSDMEKGSVVSINRAVLKHKTGTKCTFQYIAFLAVAEVLCNLTKTYLPHPSIKRCLFDECEDRSSLIEGLESGDICPCCVQKILTAKVSQEVIEDVKKILSWCSNNTWRFAISSTLGSPSLALSIAVGTAILSLALPTDLNWLKMPGLILLILFLPLIVVYRNKFHHKETAI